MGISARVTGQGGLFAKLAETRTVVRESSREETVALNDEILEGSKARAPFDTGALENSHEAVVENEPDRIRAYVTVGPVYHNGFDYAVAMHEGIVEGYPYNLGKGSLEKNTGTPHYGTGVGWKFLQRAFDAVMRVAQTRIHQKIAEALATVKET
jgi:hypothetical protein